MVLDVGFEVHVGFPTWVPRREAFVAVAFVGYTAHDAGLGYGVFVRQDTIRSPA